MTLAERFIASFHLPYVVGCLLVGSVLFGFVASFISAYAEPETSARALAVSLTPVGVLIYLLVGYAFYVPRFMRRKVVEAGVSLAALHPDGEKGYRKAFAGVSALLPQLLAWVLFLAVLLLALSVPAMLGTGEGPIQFRGTGEFSLIDLVGGVISLIAFAVITLALSSVVWTYWSVSMGIRRFGGSALRLRPYFEDGFLGLRPTGSLALSLASAYFGFIGLFLASLLVSPAALTIADILGMGGLLFGLVVLGLALFFLPLDRLHRRMVEQKARAREEVRERLRTVFPGSASRSTTPDAGEMIQLDMMDRKVAAMALWPFDLRILGWLSVIVLSVTAALITRLITLFFGV